MNKCLLIFSMVIFILLLNINTILAEDGQAGQAAAYLKLGVGARVLGMGGAFVGIANDATAAFWNPAGTAQLKRKEVSMMHASMNLDRDFDYIGYISPSGKSVMGFSWIRFSVDGIEERDNTGNLIGYFDDKEDTLFFTYAQELNKNLFAGINLKYLKQELYKNEADSMAFDVGLLYKIDAKKTIGFSATNLLAELEWDTVTKRKDKIPASFTLGFALKSNKKTTIALDLNKIESLDLKILGGIETWIKDNLAFRIGSKDGDFSVGTSFKRDDYQFDYAFQNQELGDINRISMSIKF